MSSSTNPSRKSSITSRRAPASLRIPSITRRGSNTQLSIVFAQGDSTGRTGQIEDQLSKQLDGDSGGKQMGLRSRRSSSATIRTIRTTSGLKSPDPDTASVMEEDENQGESSQSKSDASAPNELVAGPSTHNIIPTRDPSPAPTIGGRRTLNPKQSSSWLRWNSPATSFPRSASTSKGKGKEKEHVDFEQKSTMDLPHPIELPAESPSPSQPESTDTRDLPQPFNAVLQPLPDPPDTARIPPPEAKIPNESMPTPTAKSRGWFSRSIPAQMPTPQRDPQLNEVPPASQPLSSESSDPSHSIIDQVPPENLASYKEHSKSVQIPRLDDPSASTSPPPTVINKSQDNATDTTKSPEAERKAKSGWTGYLGWSSVSRENEGSSNTESARKEEPIAIQEEESAESAEPDSSISQQQPVHQQSGLVVEDVAVPLLDEPNEVVEEPTHQSTGDTQPPPAGQPWSSYLYSFVVPPPRAVAPPPAQSSPSHPVKPTSPTEDQLPAHTEPPMSDIDVPEAAPIPAEIAPAPPSEPALAPSAAASPPRQSDRRPSTTGWLNYLAFRANQKKVTASSMTTTDTDNKVSGGGEEVMDFSTDPDFPSSTPAPQHAVQRRDVKVAPELVKSLTPKPSQNLDIRKKRLSNASLKSNGSLTPLPASPKGRSSLDSARAGSLHNGSALPPPPQTSATQPNLVIPTFTDTFDRPPRSFLPLNNDVDQHEPATKGITATTTGLAWKALGAVGNYVYGADEINHKSVSQTLQEDDRETRGKKEGRSVGADLPRRIGLGSGTPDDGWKQVKRVVVVGVHGWFPAKMLNSVIGEPTGTSTKFANMMGQAVQQFFHEKGVDDIRLTLMPLEGEGTIESRVDRLYKAYLSNPAWINDLRRADAVFFAAHSQGCIVTTHLLSRMIAQGSDGGYQKVAMLAMCGVHLGPLYSISTSTVIQPYLQWFENAAARELFEFQDSTSAVSIAYQKALSMVLENEVRVVLLASLNDQVVPIYGASFSTATHPLLLRALYVDGASYTQSDFMTNLLCFAFMLKNAGIDDQRLIEHLSEATAGSLTGVGHSTPYEELSCYSIAVQYLFHAGSARSPIPPLEIEPFSARDAKNDFELPWIMRALVDSPEVKDLFPSELKDLKEGILHWRPNTKVLKEIKKRLEPMAGRQSRLRALHTSPSSTSLTSNNEGLSASPGATRALASGKALKSRL
uniref:YMC020W-like alpha/beta hydrolase domain-containing protein n=1 Tax=Kwoniella pini CBS 10737 TaxID=1296096 RepID=A0A1B9HYH3_9TREE|nr:uncharacterized protein I206_06190 [Kwoniella pini CBS 10737]OCF48322.1 hypothetical protein I206_06190 [Kwoniella pini CBS 10737]